jgi:phosphate/sulfate permease
MKQNKEFKLDKWYKKVIFVIGHFWLISPIGWLILAFAYYSYDKKKFFDKKTLYYMGWPLAIGWSISAIIEIVKFVLF